MARETMEAVDRTLSILELFLKRKELSIQELFDLSGINKTTISRIVSTLVQRGYLVQPEKRGKYSLGTIYLNYSGVVKLRLPIRSIAAPHLIMLAQKVHEAITIAYGDGQDMIVTGERFHDSSQMMNIYEIFPDDAYGMPLYCTSLGKVLLANMPEIHLQRYLTSVTLKQLTTNTITNVENLKKNLENIKQTGFAIDNEEYTKGVRGIAVCIEKSNGKIAGAMGVVSPAFRIPDARIQELMPDIKSCAAAISRTLEIKGY